MTRPHIIHPHHWDHHISVSQSVIIWWMNLSVSQEEGRSFSWWHRDLGRDIQEYTYHHRRRQHDTETLAIQFHILVYNWIMFMIIMSLRCGCDDSVSERLCFLFFVLCYPIYLFFMISRINSFLFLFSSVLFLLAEKNYDHYLPNSHVDNYSHYLGHSVVVIFLS